MLKLDTTNAMVPDEAFQDLFTRLEPEIEAMQRVVDEGGYTDDRASLNAPHDREALETTQDLAQRFRSADSIVLVGMGGPGLGAKAMQESLTGVLHNELQPKKIHYVDTVDAARIQAVREVFILDMKAGRKPLVIVCTQSGTTTESIANMQLFQEVLEEYRHDLASTMAVVTNKGSKLDTFAEARSIARLLVPPKIGGRYSALTSLGLFPLALLGIDVDGIVNGARAVQTTGLSESIQENLIAQSAASLYHQYSSGKNVLVNFMLSPDLEALGLWSRQVMAESLGKTKTIDGHSVYAGITPTVDVGSRDLHSMFQLYMEGPDDKMTSFVRLRSNCTIRVPKKSEFEELTQNVGGREVRSINRAINEGVLHAFREAKRPYLVIDVDEQSPSDLGAYLQFKMMETMFLGALMKVNPFDQPGVELYKTEMKRLLAER